MIELQPKQQFQAQETIARELRQVVQGSNFQVVLSYALAEFSLRVTPTAEQLAAVRTFILVLLNLPMPEEKAATFQMPHIDYAALAPRKPPTAETK